LVDQIAVQHMIFLSKCTSSSEILVLQTFLKELLLDLEEASSCPSWKESILIEGELGENHLVPLSQPIVLHLLRGTYS